MLISKSTRSCLAAACVAGLSFQAGAALTDSLELYYGFDGDTIGVGGITDSSGNSRDGSPRDNDGSLSIDSDVSGAVGIGNSLGNTGGDLVLAGWNGIGGTQDRTISMWVNTSTPGSGSVLAEWGLNSNGQRYTFRLENNVTQTGATTVGGLRTEIQGDYRTTSAGQTVVSDGSWNHVAAVYDYTSGTGLLEQVTMYVNGVAIATYNDNVAAQAINTSLANQVRIGGGDVAAERIVTGNIDEVGIWSRALSASEISDLSNGLTNRTIAFTNFDSTTKSAASQTMTGIQWTTSEFVTADTSVVTTASNNAGYFTTGFGATGFAPDQNIENEGPWSAEFQITLDPGTSGTIDGVVFDYAALTNGGDSQGGNFRAQNFDILVNGVAFDVQKQTTAVNGSIAFEDTEALIAGVNTITIVSSEVNGPGYNMGIDNLKLYGEVVPEPSSLALLGLGGLLMARRRR